MTMTKKHEVVGALLDKYQGATWAKEFLRDLKDAGYQIVPRKLPDGEFSVGPAKVRVEEMFTEHGGTHPIRVDKNADVVIDQMTYSIILDTVLRSEPEEA